MLSSSACRMGRSVALLAEGVDRNFFVPNRLLWEHWSPSSRRAWIEIGLYADDLECVQGRPPRGGRG